MKHRILIFMLILLAAATAVSAQKSTLVNPNDKILIENDKLMWQYLVDKKYDEYAAMLADDFEAMNGDALMSKAEYLTAVRKENVKTTTVISQKVKTISKDVSVVMTKIRVQGTKADGSPFEKTLWTSDIWLTPIENGAVKPKKKQKTWWDLVYIRYD